MSVTDPRVRRYIFHTKPDHLGRVQFTLEWFDPDGRFEPHPSKEDGKAVGYRHGQVFFTDPRPYVVQDRIDGFKVEIIDETEARA
jgi:hypothetical protein